MTRTRIPVPASQAGFKSPNGHDAGDITKADALRDDKEIETVHIASAFKDNKLAHANHQAEGKSVEQDKESSQVGSPKAKRGCE
ncbi:hypothetical protein Daus18300_004383 [Diaporthe australafricana]|uniref:Uncharacterized protein n=1 Tax=Diaporthe australafricana TaxID=127596 RepID=A0ABR3X9R2_9PEZI